MRQTEEHRIQFRYWTPENNDEMQSWTQTVRIGKRDWTPQRDRQP